MTDKKRISQLLYKVAPELMDDTELFYSVRDSISEAKDEIMEAAPCED